MSRKHFAALAAAGMLAASLSAPVAAQGEFPVVNVPEGEPIVLATFGVNTGPNATLGSDWQRAVDLAVEERGLILGHEIVVEHQDDGCSIEGGAQATLAISNNPQTVGVIGSACSTATVGGIETITNAGLTTISPSATNKDFTLAPDDPRSANPRDERYAGFARTAFSDLDQGAAVADFVKNFLGVDRAATIHDGSTYAEGLVGVFRNEFEGLGGTLNPPAAVVEQQTDMTPVLTEIATDPPDVLYFPIFIAEGAAIVTQVRDIPGLEDVVLIGSDGLFSPAFIEAAGPNIVGMYLSGPGFGAFGDAYGEFLTRLEESQGPVTAPFHAQGYDAANMMLDAIEGAATQNDDGSLDIDLGQVRANVFATTDFPGITGSLTCDEFGQCGVNAVSLYEVLQEDFDNGATPSVEIYP